MAVKIVPGEDEAYTVVSAGLFEELGSLVVKTEFLGFFAAPAANEPMHRVEAALFQVFVSGQLEPRAEIEEIAWVDPAKNCGLPLAPLTRDHVFPLVLLRRSGQNELPRRAPSGR